MDKQINRDTQLKLKTIEPSEQAAVSGGVMGTYDGSGNLIKTCTGPYMPVKTLPWIGTVRLG